MPNSKTITKKLALLTSGFIVFSILTTITNTLILWFVLVFVLSILFISKHKNNLNKKDILISFILSIIVIISNAFIGIIVFPVYLASVSILKGSNKEILFYNHSRKNELPWTLVCVFICGGFLACLNLLLSLGSYQLDLSFQPMFIFHALKAGIFEEIIFRMFLYAICIETTGYVPYNKLQETLCYILMVLPHVLLHFNSSIDIVSVIILALFFGLPFCLMMRKLNLLSAVGAHSLVDFIRFIMLGI